MSKHIGIQNFKKHILLLTVISTVAIPLINNFGLSLLLSIITGDIVYSTVSNILTVFVSALGTVNLFFVYAVLINSLLRFGFKQSKDIILLCFLRIFIVYASFIGIGAIVTTNFTNTLKSNIFYCLTNGVIDIMLLIGAIILCLFLRSKYLTENNTDITIKKFISKSNALYVIMLWTTALISAFLLAGCISDTVTDIATYGADNLSSTEVIYLVTPYIKWIAKTLVGYIVMFFTAKWLNFQWKYSNTQPEKATK